MARRRFRNFADDRSLAQDWPVEFYQITLQIFVAKVLVYSVCMDSLKGVNPMVALILGLWSNWISGL